MSDKVIAVINKPKNCQNCVWRICKYSFPLSTRRKGYTCHLKGIEDRIVGDFDYDEDVHLEDCPLISAEEYDKEIRDKAIEGIQEVVDSMEIYTAGRLNSNKVEMSVLQMQRVINRLKEIAE